MSSEIINIIVKAVVTIVFALGTWVTNKYILPWLKQNNLVAAAKIAVEAVEAAYGRYNGEEKLKAALEQLKNKGFNVDADEVIAAVKAAWLEMNTAQIASGEKETTNG